MQTFDYSPTSLEPYPKLISKEETDRKQKLIDSLSKYDNTLLFTDFKLLGLFGTPRDTSHFYKHNHKNLYLRTRSVSDKRDKNKKTIEWTNVTEDYDWEKIISHPDIPISRYRVFRLFSCITLPI